MGYSTGRNLIGGSVINARYFLIPKSVIFSVFGQNRLTWPNFTFHLFCRNLTLARNFGQSLLRA